MSRGVVGNGRAVVILNDGSYGRRPGRQQEGSRSVHLVARMIIAEPGKQRHRAHGQVAPGGHLPLVMELERHCSREPGHCGFVGEDADDNGAPLHLLVHTLERVRRPDLAPVRDREGGVGEDARSRRGEHLGSDREARRQRRRWCGWPQAPSLLSPWGCARGRCAGSGPCTVARLSRAGRTRWRPSPHRPPWWTGAGCVSRSGGSCAHRCARSGQRR